MSISRYPNVIFLLLLKKVFSIYKVFWNIFKVADTMPLHRHQCSCFGLFICCFFKIFIHLEDRDLHPLVDSPNGWAWPKPRAWNAISVFHVSGRAKARRPFSAAFLGALARSWIGSQASGILGALLWDGSVTNLTGCVTTFSVYVLQAVLYKIMKLPTNFNQWNTVIYSSYSNVWGKNVQAKGKMFFWVPV